MNSWKLFKRKPDKKKEKTDVLDDSKAKSTEGKSAPTSPVPSLTPPSLSPQPPLPAQPAPAPAPVPEMSLSEKLLQDHQYIMEDMKTRNILWFHGSINRKLAETNLRKGREHLFLVLRGP